MSQRPVLGISACNRTVGTEVAQTLINRYATAAMRHAYCAALIIPSLPEYMRASEIVGRLDGVLLTGTPSNGEPPVYGDSSEREGPFDRDRVRIRTGLVYPAIAARRPLSGLCQGLPQIHVPHGGNLGPHSRAR